MARACLKVAFEAFDASLASGCSLDSSVCNKVDSIKELGPADRNQLKTDTSFMVRRPLARICEVWNVRPCSPWPGGPVVHAGK